VKLYTLGTGTLHPVPNQASAGLALVVDDVLFGFDLGRSVVNRYVEAGLDPLALRYLHFSHIHPDHCCDIVPLLFALNYASSPARTEPLHITAPEGFTNLLDNLRRGWRWLDSEFPLHIREAEEGSFEEGAARVSTAFLDHGSIANLGYRIEADGKTVAYSGDCGPGDGLLSLAGGANILVSECSYGDAQAQASHMSPSRLGQVARAAEIEKLVVTHLYPGTDPDEVISAIGNHFDGETVVATDGMEIEL